MKSSVMAELTARQKEILALMKKNAELSLKDISGSLEINLSALQKHITKLKEKGVLKRIGPAKGGRWEVVG
jgi:ATP-dependent DNA helicase RecG